MDVVFAVPTPPPYSGPEINSALLLRLGLGPEFRIHHVRTNAGARNANKGGVSVQSLANLAMMWLRLVVVLVRVRPALLYFCLSQNRTGFLRDAVVALTGHLLGARLVAHVRGGNFAAFRSRAPTGLRRLVEFVVRRCAAVVVLGECFREQFADLVPAERLHVLYNPVDTGLFVPGDAHDGGGDVTFVFVGHLSAAKGFGDLLSAIPSIVRDVPSARFVFAGEWLERETNIFVDEHGRPVVHDAGELRRRWDELSSRYPDRLTHAGVLGRADLASLLSRADVFVLPSYSEGLPTSVLEGMAAGLPIAATPVGSLAEVLHDGEGGFLVPVGDPTALAEALVKLGRDPELRREMGAVNRRYAQDHLSPDQHTATLARTMHAALGCSR